MKIAICFSGQIRMGADATKNILNFIGDLKSNVDVFVHTWDIENTKNLFDDMRFSPEYTHTVKTEISKYVKVLNAYEPKLNKVDLFNEYHDCIFENGSEIYPMWYSWVQSVLLKSKYEKEKKFKYDVVLKLRYDTIYNPDIKLKTLINNNKQKIENDVFLVDTVTSYRNEPNRMIHDVLYMSNSKTMDKCIKYYEDILMDIKKDEEFNPHIKFDEYLKDNEIVCEEFFSERMYDWTIYREFSNILDPITNFKECVEINRILYNHEYKKLQDVKHLGYNLLVELKKQVKKKTGFAPNVLKNIRSMRIAVCLSGQFRTYDKCHQNVMKVFKKITDDPNSHVDFFCHMWNFDSESRPVLDVTFDNKVKLYPKEKIDEIIDIYKPKKYTIDNFDTNQQANQDVINIAKENFPENSGVPITWCANQFYAIMRAAELKRQYEIENNFEYDICIRLRYDQFIPEGQINELIEYLHLIKPNTMFSLQNRRVDVYPHFVVGDVFWFSDSLTFDKICNFYRELPGIDIETFHESMNHLLPEYVFYHYLQNTGIKNFTTLLDFKICKFEHFIKKKQELNLGGLGHNEVLYENIRILPNGEQYLINSTI